MLGKMMNTPLLISSLLEHGAIYHADQEIVSRTVEGPIHRYTFADALKRSKKLANALVRLGVEPGDRIATLAWNGYRHFELYYGVSGIGAVLHTVNPRLFPEQITYIVNHAEDSYVFVDLNIVPGLEALAPQFSGVKGYVIMTDQEHMPDTTLPNPMCYETLIGGESEDFDWPVFDENTASSLCYTSGTTGNPKGVLYSHRSTVLHSFAACMRDTVGLSSLDTALLIVPMFHANAWGLTYAAPMCGAKLVLPGYMLDGASVYELLDQEQVNFSAGVPTVWQMLFQYLEENGKKLDYLERIIVGGSAPPRIMLETFETKYDVRAIQGWGMTETSPLGAVCNLKKGMEKLPLQERLDIQGKAGRGIYGAELRIVDDDGNELARDGVAYGHLMIRGPWIASAYFKDEGGDVLDGQGWFDTGDIATIDPEGYVGITDRAKDLVKSGGEWISSIDVENLAVACPGVAEAAVIGIAHPKWQERPILIVVRASGSEIGKDDVLGFMDGKIASWWMPDDVLFVDELPHTATGKLNKLKLRQDLAGYELPEAAAGSGD